MQPKTNVKFDVKTFCRLRRTIKNMSFTNKKRLEDPSYTLNIPEEAGLQLTNNCNLRCKHCFQWNEEGFFHKMEESLQKEEMDIEIIKKILKQTESVKSNLYLWGGATCC